MYQIDNTFSAIGDKLTCAISKAISTESNGILELRLALALELINLHAAFFPIPGIDSNCC